MAKAIETGPQAAAFLHDRLADGPPRHQSKGPIQWIGPTNYVACAQCSIVRGRPTGVPRRHAKQHLRDHHFGLKVTT
jgi:hypothetical protein